MPAKLFEDDSRLLDRARRALHDHRRQPAPAEAGRRVELRLVVRPERATPPAQKISAQELVVLRQALVKKTIELLRREVVVAVREQRPQRAGEVGLQLGGSRGQ